MFQGARRKIAASVTRLRERPRILGEIDREVDEGRADLKRLLSELEAGQLFSDNWARVYILLCCAGGAEVSDYLGGAGICSLSLLRPPTLLLLLTHFRNTQESCFYVEEKLLPLQFFRLQVSGIMDGSAIVALIMTTLR